MFKQAFLILSYAAAQALAQTIAVDGTSYDLGDAIGIDWAIGGAGRQLGDWIAIYDSETTITGGKIPDTGVLWVYVETDDQVEPPVAPGNTLASGSIAFDANDSEWPLPPGSYIAHLIRDGTEPFTVLASSGEFTVTGSDMIDIDKGCYEYNAPISIVWDYEDGLATDWIAVYVDGAVDNGQVPEESQLWVYAGSEVQGGATGVQETGQVTFDENDPHESDFDLWPLDAGTYQAHLLRDGSAPFDVIHTSRTFTVMAEGATCPDTAAPTMAPLTCANMAGTECAFTSTGTSTGTYNAVCIQETKAAKKGAATTSYKNVCADSTALAGLAPGDNLSTNQVIAQCGCCDGVVPAAKDEDWCASPVCTPSDASFTVCKTEKSNSMVSIDACVAKVSKKGDTKYENKCVDPFDSSITSCGACP